MLKKNIPILAPSAIKLRLYKPCVITTKIYALAIWSPNRLVLSKLVVFNKRCPKWAYRESNYKAAFFKIFFIFSDSLSIGDKQFNLTLAATSW